MAALYFKLNGSDCQTNGLRVQQKVSREKGDERLLVCGTQTIESKWIKDGNVCTFGIEWKSRQTHGCVAVTTLWPHLDGKPVLPLSAPSAWGGQRIGPKIQCATFYPIAAASAHYVTRPPRLYRSFLPTPFFLFSFFCQPSLCPCFYYPCLYFLYATIFKILWKNSTIFNDLILTAGRVISGSYHTSKPAWQIKAAL